MTEECHGCKSISGVYYDLCDDCMTELNALRGKEPMCKVLSRMKEERDRALEQNKRLWADRKSHDDYIQEAGQIKRKHIANIQRAAKIDLLHDMEQQVTTLVDSEGGQGPEHAYETIFTHTLKKLKEERNEDG